MKCGHYPETSLLWMQRNKTDKCDASANYIVHHQANHDIRQYGLGYLSHNRLMKHIVTSETIKQAGVG